MKLLEIHTLVCPKKPTLSENPRDPTIPPSTPEKIRVVMTSHVEKKGPPVKNCEFNIRDELSNDIDDVGVIIDNLEHGHLEDLEQIASSQLVGGGETANEKENGGEHDNLGVIVDHDQMLQADGVAQVDQERDWFRLFQEHLEVKNDVS